MDSCQFDELSRLTATSRRSILAGLFGGLIAAMAAPVLSASDAEARKRRKRNKRHHRHHKNLGQLACVTDAFDASCSQETLTEVAGAPCQLTTQVALDESFDQCPDVEGIDAYPTLYHGLNSDSPYIRELASAVFNWLQNTRPKGGCTRITIAQICAMSQQDLHDINQDSSCPVLFGCRPVSNW